MPTVTVPVPSPAELPASAPRRLPLAPERADFLGGDVPVADQVAACLAQALPAASQQGLAAALVPWVCDALLSRHSLKAYGRDLVDFVRHMEAQGAGPLRVTADHVKLHKRALLEAGLKPTTVARRLSVLRGTYRQLAAQGLVAWETAQTIGAVRAPPVQKNTTPALTQRQAVALLEAIPTHTLQGARDFALMGMFFLTGCRVSAVVRACVGHLETDGVEHYLHVTEKRGKRRRKILLDAARAVRAYLARAGIERDVEGPLFRPLAPDGRTLVRRHLERKTPWRLVKKYCRAAGIEPGRLGGRGVGVHSLRKTAINDAIRNGAGMHEVREFAGHADIRVVLWLPLCGWRHRPASCSLPARQLHYGGLSFPFFPAGVERLHAKAPIQNRQDRVHPALPRRRRRDPIADGTAPRGVDRGGVREHRDLHQQRERGASE